jgi:fatty-acid desaturase
VDKVAPKKDYPVIILFALITTATLIGVPAFGLTYGFNALDWVMFVVLYMVSGLGITVGYHRLISHRSFECRDWVKACLLVGGGGRWRTRRSGGVRIISGTMHAAIRRKTLTTP